MTAPIALDDCVPGMLEALQLELATIRKELGVLGDLFSVPVSDGALLVAEPGAYLYRFRCELEQRIPVDTQVQLVAPADSVSGEVFAHDPDADQLELTLRNALAPAVPRAELQLDPSHLLSRLAQRLQCIVDEPDRFFADRALALLTGQRTPRRALPVTRPGLNRSQLRAIGFVLANDVSYVWGPPGTGKTRTVAHLIHELVARGERVLIAAHTNVATDNALLQVLEQGALPRDRVVRVGRHGDALRGHRVGLEDVVDRVLRDEHRGLVSQIGDFCTRVAAAVPAAQRAAIGAADVAAPKRFRSAAELLLRSRSPAQDELLGEAAPIDGALQSIEREVIEQAAVVAATLARTYTSAALQELRTDNVVIDEASVASLAQCFAAASIAARRAVAVGDFMQLPTIVRSDHPQARAWLGRHVFASAGADDAATEHPLRAMLVEQYRMHPQISRLVSETFYAGKLRDADALAGRSDARPAVLVIDTVGPSCCSERTRTGSKRNRHHAAVIAELVAAAGTADIAVITPYRAQVRLIRDALRASAGELLASGQLEVFTVHRFQGRDKELVIFDTVEAPGTPAAFLDELANQDAPNLVNVALSRARRRLVIVSHIPHLKAALGQQCLLARIFRHVCTHGGEEAQWSCAEDRRLVHTFLGG